MENLCYFCKQSGKDVTARFVIDGHFACAAHEMEHRKKAREHGEQTLADGPTGGIPSESNTAHSDTPKVRTPGRLERAAETAPLASNPPLKKRRGRKPGSKNKPKQPKVAATVKHAQQDFAAGRRPGASPPTSFSKDLTISELLTKLRARRAALNEAIESMELAERALAAAEELT
jgi:hypothetical protein